MAQRLKCLPTIWETQVRSLGQEDPLEKEMATHSSTFAWRIPWREESCRLQSMGSQRVGYNWATSLTHSLKIATGLPWWLSGKESACQVGDLGSIPGSGRCPGGENGNLLQHSCLGNSTDRGAWRATVNGVSKRAGPDLADLDCYYSAQAFQKIPMLF